MSLPRPRAARRRKPLRAVRPRRRAPPPRPASASGAIGNEVRAQVTPYTQLHESRRQPWNNALIAADRTRQTAAPQVPVVFLLRQPKWTLVTGIEHRATRDVNGWETCEFTLLACWRRAFTIFMVLLMVH